jgi:hypothetical protein
MFMNRYTKSIAVAFLLVAATTLTKAQDAPGNPLPPVSNKFGDIVEVNLDDIGTGQGLMMGVKNIFLLRRTEYFSVGAGIGLEGGQYSSSSVPLSADFRYYLNPNKAASPFFNLYTGYSFNFGRYQVPNANDVFLGLNFGVNIMVTHDVSLQLALGLKLDHYGDLLSENSGDGNFLSVPFTIGLVF